jgi:S-adenosylmethionine hydrolase
MRSLLCFPLLILSLSALAAPVSEEPASPERANGIVALVTDYGWQDFYVGALKGAILSAWPEAHIEDVTHDVPSFDIAGGSFLLAAAARGWPAGTVFVAVVDPGVGTARRSVALRTRNGLFFVGPDNGLFTHVAEEMGIAEIHEITNEALMRPGAMSSTFHGRDIYGPVGARLASGVPLAEVGPAVNDVVRVPLISPTLENGEIRAQILLADHYGNLLTNVPESMLSEIGVERGKRLAVTVQGHTLFVPLMRTYGDVAVGDDVALINSLGLLEVATNQGSMAGKAGASSGDEIRLGPELFLAPRPER